MSYIERYERFIDSLKGQTIDGAFEVHHIVPRSLGGSDDADNLIKLTPRQHYIAHWMLWKAHKGKMAQAFFFMNNHKNYKRMYSRGYEKVRADAISSLSGSNSWRFGKPMDLDLREKLSLIHKERLKNPETRAKIFPQISALQPDKEAYKRQAKSISSLVWLNDGVRSYRVKPEFVEKKLAEGLVHGRLTNYIDDSFKEKRKLIASRQWAAVKSTGHTGLLIKV